MNTVVFNNYTLNEYLVVKNIKDPILPPVSNTKVEFGGKRGSRVVRSKLEEKSIEIEVEIKERNIQSRVEKIDILKKILYTEEEVELTLRDRKSYKAKLDGDTNFDNLHGSSIGSLLFIASDPIGYTQKVTVNLSNKIFNNGTYKTTGIITVNINSTVNHLQVKLKETGEFIRIEDSLKNGDTIIIDLDNEYITKNGYSAMKHLTLESDFFDLPVGEFEIELSSGNGTLQFRERWL